MNKHQKIIISIVGIVIVLLALVGITYGYFLTRIIGNTNDKSVSIKTALLELKYDDESSQINMSNLFPGQPIPSKTFSVENRGQGEVEYGVYLENVVNELVLQDDLLISLTCTSVDRKTGVPSGSCVGTNPDEEYYYPATNEQIITNTIGVGLKHNYTLTITYLDDGNQSVDMGKTIEGKVQIYAVDDVFDIEVDGTNLADTDVLELHSEVKTARKVNGKYKFVGVMPDEHKLTVKSSTGSELGTSDLSVVLGTGESYNNGTVNVTKDTKKLNISINSVTNNKVNFDDITFGESSSLKLLNQEIINNAKNVTEEEIEKGYAEYSKDPKTFPAEKFSESDESTLSETPDDYTVSTGINSYYFRGNVKNNYVNFAGMCWRIVRIDGNSNIKLILEDQYTTCDDDETSETDTIKYTGAWDIEASDGTNITMNGSTPLRNGNFGYDDSSGEYKMSYLNPVDNKDRAMVNAFKYFQTNTLKNKINTLYNGKNLSDYLVSGNWCLNNKAYSDGTGTTLIENPDYSSKFYYDSYVRLYGKTTKEPTLKCPVETMETFGDNTTPMYVGALTADEIVYAGGIVGSINPGGIVGSNNPNYYLINKWQNSNSFRSLSPYDFSGYDDRAFSVDGGGLLSSDLLDCNIAFRPSVSLVSSVTVLPNGNGDITNPYVIG